MKKRWLAALGALIIGLVTLWLRKDMRPASASAPQEERNASSRWKPAPAAPVTAGSAAPAAHLQSSQPKGKPRLTKAEYDQWVQSTQTQMKISLAATYGGEKSFYSEYHRYSTDFNAIGYSPEPDEIPFKVGFIRAFNPTKSLGPTEGTSYPASSLDELDQYLQENARRNGKNPQPFNFTDSAKGVRIEDAARYCQSECTASETGFEAIAVANLDDDPDLDVWLINDKKQMQHIHDDLAP